MSYYLAEDGWRYKVGTHRAKRKTKKYLSVKKEWDKAKQKAIRATRDCLVLALLDESWCVAEDYGSCLKNMLGR